MKPPECIPVDQCKKGVLYVLASRNLGTGVFNGDTKEPGFIGIREKFGNYFLFTEYHYDNGPPYGTASPIKELAIVPDGIGIFESFPTEDSVTGRPVKFDTPIAQGGRGWYFIDTNEASTEIRPVSRENKALFDWIKNMNQSQDG